MRFLWVYSPCLAVSTGVANSPSVKKVGSDVTPQMQEGKVATNKEEARAATSIPYEAKSCCAVKKEETVSHPTDKRTIQQIISEITGEKTGPDNSGDLYSGGLTATYTRPEEVLPGEGKFGKLFGFLPLIRWYVPTIIIRPIWQFLESLNMKSALCVTPCRRRVLLRNGKRVNMP